MNMSNIKFSEITLDIVKEYLSIEPEFTRDDEIINMYIDSAKDYIKDATSRNDTELDETKYSVMLLLKLVCEFYEKRGIVKVEDDLFFNSMIRLMEKRIF